MKLLYVDQSKAIVRCNKGDDVMEVLARFAQEHNVQSAGFFGVGACGSLTLSFYDLEQKEYIDKDFNEDLEIVSFSGNIAWLKEKPLIHGHGVFSDRAYQTVGGHVKKMIISATCELVIAQFPHKLERSHDE